MPGLELFSSSSPSTANTIVEVSAASSSVPPSASVESKEPEHSNEVVAVPRGLAGPAAYYNPRLDPKNFLEGPLSWNPATRLRQMLARPGIVVSTSPTRLYAFVHIELILPRVPSGRSGHLRRHQRTLRA